MIEVVEEYLPQIIASVFIILLTPLSKYVSRKIIIKYGQLTLKAEARIFQIIQVINIHQSIFYSI